RPRPGHASRELTTEGAALTYHAAAPGVRSVERNRDARRKDDGFPAEPDPLPRPGEEVLRAVGDREPQAGPIAPPVHLRGLLPEDREARRRPLAARGAAGRPRRHPGLEPPP